ncbi:MAG: histidine triad nucleotide-binding protein [Candidatus Brocadiia bacterium]
MSECVFCRIIRGEIGTKEVYQDEDIFAFRDISPQAPTHILVIPKKHYANLLEMPAGSGVFEKMFAAVGKIAKSEHIDESGFRAVFNCKSEGGQAVNHVHLHLLGGRQLSARLG